MKASKSLIGICLLLASCSGGGGGGGGDDLSRNACSTIGLPSRIIDGTACSDTNSPVVKITLFNADGSSALCSGSMLTSDDVLTAAHCLVTTNVVAANVTANGVDIPVREIVVHPGVTFSQEAQAIFNDVAILRLNSPVSLPTLPILASTDVGSDDVIAIYGYGRDEDGNFETLRSGESRVGSVTPQHLIAAFDGQEGSNSCNGDSGGPAVFTPENGPAGIVGIVSSGNNPQCGAGDISLYANVQDELLGFIVANVPDARVI